MSKFTTELRFICETKSGLNESEGYTHVNEIIENSLDKIFNFDYPIFDENYRTVLETKIVKHFYTREIGAETFGLWELWLDRKMNEIMPFYNKLYQSELLEFNPLYTANFTTTRTITGTNSKTENETINDTNANTRHEDSNGSNNSQNSDTSWNMYSDTPQGAITNLDNGTYLTNATKNTDSGTNNTTVSNTIDTQDNGSFDRSRGVTGNGNTTENYLETIVGYHGTNPSKLLQDYRSTFLNIDMQIINELEELFMQLW